jgi:hypothetical protein
LFGRLKNSLQICPIKIIEKMKLTVCNMSCKMPEPSAETLL